MNTGYTLDQTKAFIKLINTKDNRIFLTGGAGTGKSFLLREYLRQAKHNDLEVAVLAPTGIAARNIDGVTCHRFFGLGISPQNPDEPLAIPDALKIVDTLIIDEISMVRCDIFDAIMDCVERTEEVLNRKIKVILCGDFFQLPPVIMPRDRASLIRIYGTQNIGKLFAFQSKYWQGFKTIVLEEIVRQSNTDFAVALNKVRFGDKLGLEWIEEHASKEMVEATLLAPGYKIVDRENDHRLAELSTQQLGPYTLTKTGYITTDDIRFPESLTLKIGCQVMVLMNEPVENPRYYNGSTGIVESVDIEDGIEVINVRIKHNNLLVPIYPVTQNVYDYDVINKNGKNKLYLEEIGRYTQYPLRPFYALTIHKSQGQSLAAMQLEPGNWMSGMLYTALSRVTDVENLYLRKSLRDITINSDAEVKKFYSDPDNYQYDWTDCYADTSVDVSRPSYGYMTYSTTVIQKMFLKKLPSLPSLYGVSEDEYNELADMYENMFKYV